jgi:hypothetical protein
MDQLAVLGFGSGAEAEAGGATSRPGKTSQPRHTWGESNRRSEAMGGRDPVPATAIAAHSAGLFGFDRVPRPALG